jgi:hypothetical protein
METGEEDLELIENLLQKTGPRKMQLKEFRVQGKDCECWDER